MPRTDFAVIAAAGTGSRLGRGLPKCLIEVGGRTLLGHLLARLSDVPNIHICVGFMANDVIAEARRHRSDIVFVMNHAFRTTTTLTSYVMAARGINAPCLFMDADIYFLPDSFEAFLKTARECDEPMIAVTAVKTEHCVYARQNADGDVVAFSRTQKSQMEWANLAWLPPGTLEDDNAAVFENLESHLPLKCVEIDSFEVDTPEDLSVLNAYFSDKK